MKYLQRKVPSAKKGLGEDLVMFLKALHETTSHYIKNGPEDSKSGLLLIGSNIRMHVLFYHKQIRLFFSQNIIIISTAITLLPVL